jgi:hypothetical protein
LGVAARYFGGETVFAESPMEPLLDTEAASSALDGLGVRRSPKTLRKLRCVGGGPRFRRLGLKPVYTHSDLIAWVEEQLSAPVASNAEADAKHS